MTQLRRARHIGGRACDAFGHFGHRALETGERAQHPSGERTGDNGSHDEHGEAADRHPQPVPRDIACGDRGVDREYDGAHQFAVLSDSRRGDNRTPPPRHDRCPLRRRRVDEGVARGRCDAGIRDAEPTRSQSLAIGIDDQQAFAVDLVIAVHQALQWGVRGRRGVRERGELPVPLRGERRGSAVGQRQRKRNGECRNGQQ